MGEQEIILLGIGDEAKLIFSQTELEQAPYWHPIAITDTQLEASHDNSDNPLFTEQETDVIALACEKQQLIVIALDLNAIWASDVIRRINEFITDYKGHMVLINLASWSLNQVNANSEQQDELYDFLDASSISIIDATYEQLVVNAGERVKLKESFALFYKKVEQRLSYFQSNKFLGGLGFSVKKTQRLLNLAKTNKQKVSIEFLPAFEQSNLSESIKHLQTRLSQRVTDVYLKLSVSDDVYIQDIQLLAQEVRAAFHAAVNCEISFDLVEDYTVEQVSISILLVENLVELPKQEPKPEQEVEVAEPTQESQSIEEPELEIEPEPSLEPASSLEQDIQDANDEIRSVTLIEEITEEELEEELEESSALPPSAPIQPKESAGMAMSQLIVEPLDTRETPSIEEKVAQISADFHNSQTGPDVAAMFDAADDAAPIADEISAELDKEEDRHEEESEDINQLFEDLIDNTQEEEETEETEDVEQVEDAEPVTILETEPVEEAELDSVIEGEEEELLQENASEGEGSIFDQELESLADKDPQDIFKQEYESFSQRVESENKAIDDSKIFTEDGSIIKTKQDDTQDEEANEQIDEALNAAEASAALLIDEIKLQSDKEIEASLAINEDAIFGSEEPSPAEASAPEQDEILDIEKELAALNAKQAELTTEKETIIPAASEPEAEPKTEPDTQSETKPELSQATLESQSAFSSLKNVANKIVKKSSKDKEPETIQDSLFGAAMDNKSQSEFNFGTEEMKGIFKQDEPNLFNGEDLNTPAYARRK